MSDLWKFFASPIYSVLVSLFAGYFFARFTKAREDNKALKEKQKDETANLMNAIAEGVRFLMFQSLQNLYNEISSRKTITAFELKKWNDTYSIYSEGLHGDGVGEAYNREIQQMKVINKKDSKNYGDEA